MPYSKKRRGWRTIAVDEQQYRWTLRPSSPNSLLEVTAGKKSGQRLEATLFGWQDPWLAISGMKVVEERMTLFTDAANVPTVIASGFVRELIEFGLSRGWTPDVQAALLRVGYNGRLPKQSRFTIGNSAQELEAWGNSADTADWSGELRYRVLTETTRLFPTGR